MAIYYDNFETYGTITTTPFGSFTSGGAVILAGTNYVTTGSHVLNVTDNANTAVFSTGSLYSSSSIWVAFQVNAGASIVHPLVSLQNGTSFPAIPFNLVRESDGSISILGQGVFGGNSTNFAIHPNTWYFMQINTTMFDAAGTLACAFDVGIEGTSVVSGTMTTTVLTTNTPSHTAQWDHLILGNTVYYDEFTLDTSTTMGVYPNPGVPLGRVTTGLIEVVRLNSDANIRATTGLIELIIAQHGWEVREA